MTVGEVIGRQLRLNQTLSALEQASFMTLSLAFLRCWGLETALDIYLQVRVKAAVWSHMGLWHLGGMPPQFLSFSGRFGKMTLLSLCPNTSI